MLARTRMHKSAGATFAAVALIASMACFAVCARGFAADTPDRALARAFGDTYSPRMPDPFPPEALVARKASLASGPAGCPALLDYRMDDLRGRRIDLCAFRGKVLLLVNTASFCGYTPQYRALEALYERYRAAGLVVIGFPSNDFGAQEPGNNAEIQDFCEGTYGVRFPMFGKVAVKGGMDQTPLFRRLTALATPQVPAGEIEWNFEKFLLDREGRLVARYRSAVEPDSPEFEATLRSLLAHP